MKVCVIVEGAYPYVTGGVSSWLQRLMVTMKDVEFVVQSIAAYPDSVGTFKYKIPDNVTEIQEVYLLDDDYVNHKTQRKVKLTGEEYDAFEQLMFETDPDWDVIIQFFAQKQVSLNALLSGKDFFKMTLNYYNHHFRRVGFSDFLWTMRSLYLPLFTILKSRTQEADLYHSVSAGYAGIWGCMEKVLYNRPFLMTEHGIYTREREEEIIKADWVSGIYKNIWIDQFRKIGSCCYTYADKVVSLFEDARQFQIQLGCKKEKTLVIPNGVDEASFQKLEPKSPKDLYIHIGAVLRVSPVKDVKTLISAFALARHKNKRLKLWIMGGMDEDEAYAKECMAMVEDMQVEEVVFTGVVNVKDYIGKMDFLMLTSISEGQPLSILEGFAAKKPCIATNVGNCRGLIEGEKDQFGNAGYIVPVMGVAEIARVILKMAESKERREQMGQAGYDRVVAHYREKDVFNEYEYLYKTMTEEQEEQPWRA